MTHSAILIWNNVSETGHYFHSDIYYTQLTKLKMLMQFIQYQKKQK
jgi:hypothetical protein